MKDMQTDKRSQVIFWSITLLFAVPMALAGIGELIGLPAGVAILEQLGYPHRSRKVRVNRYTPRLNRRISDVNSLSLLLYLAYLTEKGRSPLMVKAARG
jgi:hypothetical protein